MKQCAKCKREQGADQLYLGDSTCRQCRVDMARVNRQAKRELYRQRDRERYAEQAHARRAAAKDKSPRKAPPKEKLTASAMAPRPPSPQQQRLLDRAEEVEAMYLAWATVDRMAEAFGVHRGQLTKFIRSGQAAGLIAKRTGKPPKREQAPSICPPDPKLTDEQQARIRALAAQGLPWAGPVGVTAKAGIPPRAWTEAYGIYQIARTQR